MRDAKVVCEYLLPRGPLFRVVIWPEGNEDGPTWVLEKKLADAMGAEHWAPCGTGWFDERQREIARHVAAAVAGRKEGSDG